MMHFLSGHCVRYSIGASARWFVGRRWLANSVASCWKPCVIITPACYRYIRYVLHSVPVYAPPTWKQQSLYQSITVWGHRRNIKNQIFDVQKRAIWNHRGKVFRKPIIVDVIIPTISQLISFFLRSFILPCLEFQSHVGIVLCIPWHACCTPCWFCL